MSMITSMRRWNTNTVTSTTSTTGIFISKRCRSRIHTGIAMSRFAISIRTIRICTIDIGMFSEVPNPELNGLPGRCSNSPVYLVSRARRSSKISTSSSRMC